MNSPSLNTETKTPLNLICKTCNHVWALCYLPMLMSKVSHCEAFNKV
jgi:hypothetical protein